MSIATGSNTAMPTETAAPPASGEPDSTGAEAAFTGAAASAAAALPGDEDADQVSASTAGAVERALAAAVRDADRIGDLLDVLRTARLWLPLPDDGRPVVRGTAVTLPTVSYLGSDFVPAYSSPELLARLADPHPAGVSAAQEPSGSTEPAAAQQPVPPADPGIAVLPHVVVRAADLARLLPPDVGIALNAGASESVPVYPQGVSYLAAGADDDWTRVRVGALPVRPDGLLASIAAELMRIPAVAEAAAAWLSVQFAGEGLLIAVTLDSPNDPDARDSVIAAVERAAWQAAAADAGFPIDVTFPGESDPDDIDLQMADVGTAFYRR
jgi:hypothetical protein